MIPTALCGELLDVQPDLVPLGILGLDDPGAFGVHCVIANGVRQPAFVTRQTENQEYEIGV